MNQDIIKAKLNFLGYDLVEELMQNSQIMEIPKNTIIMESGKYVKVLPILIKGLLKVYSQHEEKELLLYYIEENETCVMSYMACLKNNPSKVLAKTEEDSILLAIPSNIVQSLANKYSRFTALFNNQYDKRYSDLLETINHLIFDKLDVRVYDFLKTKAKMLKNNSFKITHKQIANELGTAREVVSRIMKKLEQEGKISSINGEIVVD